MNGQISMTNIQDSLNKAMKQQQAFLQSSTGGK